MSKSSATGRIVCIGNGKTYFSTLQCDQGDINQFYSDTGEVVPSFGGNNTPILGFYAYDSENAGAPAEIKNEQITWTVNGVKLSFSDKGVSTNSFNGVTGHFERYTATVAIDSNNSVEIRCLKIVKNLTTIAGNTSFAISATAVLSVDNTSVSLSAVFPVTISKGEITSRKVRIQSPTSYKGVPFKISKKYATDSNGALVDGCYCKLEAVVISVGVENANAYTFEWAKQGENGWQSVTADAGNNGSILTVTEDMVDGSNLFRCVVKKDGVEYGQDIQNVDDISDPYQVYPNCVNEKGEPAIMISYRGSGVATRFKPYIKTGDTTVDASRVKFRMKLFNSIGTQLNEAGKTYTNTPPFTDSDVKTEFVIPEKFVSDNAGIDWMIDADITDKPNS